MNRRGSVDPLPSGRFRARVSGGHGQRQIPGTFLTEEEAWRAIEAALLAIDESRREYDGLTICELGHKILTRREVHKEVRNPQNDWSRFGRHIKSDPIGSFAIERLYRQPKEIVKWLARLRDKGLSTLTVRACRTLLSVILREAVEQGIIHSNPCAEIRVRVAKKSDEDGWTYLVPSEQTALMNAASERDRLIIAFAIGTGLRAGELCALRRVDVDLEGERLMVRFGGPPDLPTKTGKVRPVPLFGMALEAARQWVALVNPPADGPMFPRPERSRPSGIRSRYGVFRDQSAVIDRFAWKAALKAAGLTRRVRWHDLRHTCASSLVSGWWTRSWNLQEVKELLGHSTIDVTQRYAHLAPGALQEAARGTGIGLVTQVTPNRETAGETVHETSAKLLPLSAESGHPPGAHSVELRIRSGDGLRATNWSDDSFVTSGPVSLDLQAQIEVGAALRRGLAKALARDESGTIAELERAAEWMAGGGR